MTTNINDICIISEEQRRQLWQLVDKRFQMEGIASTGWQLLDGIAAGDILCAVIYNDDLKKHIGLQVVGELAEADAESDIYPCCAPTDGSCLPRQYSTINAALNAAPVRA